MVLDCVSNSIRALDVKCIFISICGREAYIFLGSEVCHVQRFIYHLGHKVFKKLILPMYA